jgi:xylose isomerase
MDVEQLRQRTVFPRALWGTANTFRHAKFGHRIRTGFSIDMP